MNILKKHQIDFDWKTICVGCKLGLFYKHDIVGYADEQLANGLSYDWLIDIVCDSDQLSLDDLLNLTQKNIDFAVEENSKDWHDEFRKIRLSKLMDIDETSKDQSELLQKTSLLYDDLGYPKDMVSFINYMPSSNDKSLTENFIRFLKEEKLYITSF